MNLNYLPQLECGILFQIQKKVIIQLSNYFLETIYFSEKKKIVRFDSFFLFFHNTEQGSIDSSWRDFKIQKKKTKSFTLSGLVQYECAGSGTI